MLNRNHVGGIGAVTTRQRLSVIVAGSAMRESAAIVTAVGALMLSGSVAHADPQSPAPSPPFYAPNCYVFGGQPPALHNLPCGWTTDGKRWTPPPPPPVT